MEGLEREGLKRKMEREIGEGRCEEIILCLSLTLSGFTVPPSDILLSYWTKRKAVHRYVLSPSVLSPSSDFSRGFLNI
jgi:hypothetical protein